MSCAPGLLMVVSDALEPFRTGNVNRPRFRNGIGTNGESGFAFLTKRDPALLFLQPDVPEKVHVIFRITADIVGTIGAA